MGTLSNLRDNIQESAEVAVLYKAALGKAFCHTCKLGTGGLLHQGLKLFVFLVSVYLFGCTGSQLQHTGSLIFVVACRIFSGGSQELVPKYVCVSLSVVSNSTRGQTQALCFGSSESQPLDHQGSPQTETVWLKEMKQTPEDVQLSSSVIAAMKQSVFAGKVNYINIQGNFSLKEASHTQSEG